ncbi:NAD(P)H-hydrate dehydratase [Magnetovibrio sp.]|uniref:NAD(P)H-hydrate dehydratase n=1 Tax=Magnetovibrio sp. TaxID=2024836 RepID=UPI002F92B4DA
MEVLSVSQMRAADEAAISQGVGAKRLMEAAGQAVCNAVLARWEKRAVAVLVGPGKNGGDGFVVARLLKKAGWPVTVYIFGDKSAYTGESLTNAKRWRSKVEPLQAALDVIAGLENGDDLLVVDALFGAGLSRPLDGVPKILAELVTVSQAQGTAPVVVAVDVPSGLCGDTARALGGKRGGICFHADLTVTFCRPKPAHALMPGRSVCGEIVVADIGIDDAVVAGVFDGVSLNTSALWGEAYPRQEADTHKYVRGHMVVLGGGVMTGAARLVAGAARRAGAGLVSIAAPEDAFAIYAASVDPGTLTPSFKGAKGWRKLIADPRKNSCVIGPGAGVSRATRGMTLTALETGKRCVLDADALTVFENDAKALFKAVKANLKANGGIDSVVMTPHGGEFPRLFPDLAQAYANLEKNGENGLSKLDVTREAARRAGCVVLFKGPDTVIAAPDGRAALTTNAPRTLATAGAGDVLAGIIGALLAQGMPGFEAANAAAWLHGEAATAFGEGLIAEDIAEELPDVLQWLMETLA